MSRPYMFAQDVDPDAGLSFSGPDNLDTSHDTSSQYSIKMLDSLDASRASSFAAHAYYYRFPEQAGDVYSPPKKHASTGYSPVSSPSPRFRPGVEYLEPRYVEGRVVDTLAPYYAHRVVDLQGNDIERRQVTSMMRRIEVTRTEKQSVRLAGTYVCHSAGGSRRGALHRREYSATSRERRKKLRCCRASACAHIARFLPTSR
jgi:hypothetical protein